MNPNTSFNSSVEMKIRNKWANASESLRPSIKGRRLCSVQSINVKLGGGIAKDPMESSAKCELSWISGSGELYRPVLRTGLHEQTNVNGHTRTGNALL